MGLLDFLFMYSEGDYEERKVANFTNDDCGIDTCKVRDGYKPYETAVAHIQYNSSKWIIVEAYDSEEEAMAGHKKWVKKMTSSNLPTKLTDCINCDSAKICFDALGEGSNTFIRDIPGINLN